MGPPVRQYSNFLRGIRSLPARVAAYIASGKASRNRWNLW